MTFKQFIDKNKNKALDWDGAYGAQCVDLARFYWRDVLGINQPRGVAGAKDFWTNYDSDPNLKNNFNKIPNTRELIPVMGDVMIWGSSYGKWGHIAIVTEGTIDNFTCFSQNDPTGTKSIIKYYKNFNGVLGVLRPKRPNNGSSESEGDNMADMYKGYDLENKESMKVAVDVLVRLQAGEFVETSKLDELVKVKTAELSSKISDYDRKIKELNTDIFNLNESIRELNQDLEECQNQVPTEEDLEKDYEATGRRIIKVVGDTTIETSYKRK
jgi:hypothetical protein